jgi:hypothetical protein
MFLPTSQVQNCCEMPEVYYRLAHILTGSIASMIFGRGDELDRDPKEVTLLLIVDRSSGF